MKILVVYSSQTGNTKKLAEAAYEVLPEPKEIYNVKDNPSPDNYDVIIVGFWFKKGKPDPASSEYLAKIKNKKVFLIGTHGAAPDSEHAKKGMEEAKKMLQDCEILGTFNCQGEVAPQIMQKAASKPTPPEWYKDAPLAKGHPDENDISNLVQKIKQVFS